MSRRGAAQPLSVAPMMDRTDRHFRYLLRGITGHVLLYSEMITARAVLFGDRERLLGFHPDERPLVLQLGGSDAGELSEAARIAEGFGYDELNLNVGCPSPRVAAADFGASLMARPDVVARAVEAMRRATALPVTVKHRIGIDDRDRYEDMAAFVRVVAGAGADAFSVHARKAWLSGLSPRENREIPSLRYEDVYRLKREHPRLSIELNGGVRDLDDAARHLAHVDGVMIGRAAYDDPMLLAGADARFYPSAPGAAAAPSRRMVVERMLPYLEARLAEGATVHAVVRHLLPLFRGVPGGKRWRRHLTEGAHRPGAGPELVHEALALVGEEALDTTAAPVAAAA
ncbi:MAG TPA: tRNA dihydrouridine(20/20a) synthase DusA [Trueperaceae bacterium]|nr:tRNA dihydrouridine(20/20a) synthase DusA [Trueperaceae bacterium]